MYNLPERTEQLLRAITAGTADPQEVQALTVEIKTQMKANPSLGSRLGPLLPRINKALKARPQLPQLNWVQVNEGFLAIGHKPGGKISFEGLKLTGTTAVLTLLQENEGAIQIGNALEKLQLTWLWFPFSANRPETKETTEKLFEKMQVILQQQGRIYVHCSAGIHRTGMLTYAFLRFLGQNTHAPLSHFHRLSVKVA